MRRESYTTDVHHEHARIKTPTYIYNYIYIYYNCIYNTDIYIIIYTSMYSYVTYILYILYLFVSMINILTCLAFISDPDPWQSQILFVQSFVRPCPASTSWQGRACEQCAGQGAELAGRGGNVQWEPIRDQGGFP
jgi:hypothetical protein